MKGIILVAKNGDYSQFEDFKLVKEDRNGTRTYTKTTYECPKCGGRGYLDYYSHVEGGICFLCNGSGRYGQTSTYIVRTEAYHNKMEAKRIARQRAKAEDLNKELFEKNGLSEDGKAYIVMGNTYQIKEELKEEGARYHKALNWYFSRPEEGYKTIEIEVVEYDEETHIAKMKDYIDLEYIVKEKKEEAERKENEGKTEYAGEIKQKISANVILEKHIQHYERYGYEPQLVNLYIMRDSDNHVFTWNTQKNIEVEEGKALRVSGTIKALKEYRGMKQTVLTRCKTEKL